MNDTGNTLLALGADFEKRGLLAQAQEYYQRAATEQPDSAEALFALGSLALRQAQHPVAQQFLSKAHRYAPNRADICCRLALSHEFLKEDAMAVQFYQHAIALDPRYLDAYADLAELLYRVSENTKAITLLDKALEIDNSVSRLWNVRAKNLLALGKTDDAIQSFKRAIEVDPTNSNALGNLGGVYCRLERYDESLPLLQRAHSLAPQTPHIVNNLALLYLETNQLDEAETLFNSLRVQSSLTIEALGNLGLLAQRRGNLDQALYFYELALKRNPQYAHARWLRSHVLLAFGNFREGWQEYEFRLKDTRRFAPSPVNAPRWNGQQLHDGILYLYQEQGVGDQLMFLTCLPDALKMAPRIILNCDRRLHSLLARRFPQITICDRAPSDAVSAQLPVGSLPLFFRNEAENYKQTEPLLSTDPTLTKEWHLRLASLGPGLKVGISWRGGARQEVARKSLLLDVWQNILLTPNVHFINVQYDANEEEVSNYNRKLGVAITHFAQLDSRNDFEGFSALLQNLDLLISVSNTTVHLAGTLGVPTYLLLPDSQNWRWGISGKHTLWYPSVTVLRNDRNSVLKVAEKRLNRMAAPN